MLLNKLKVTALCLVGIGFAAASQGFWSPAAVKAAAEDDRDRLQGNWKVISGEVGGEKLPADAMAAIRFEFSGNKLLIKAGDEAHRTIDFKLDPKTTPKAIDLSEAAENKQVKGIYQLDADTLKISFVEAENAGRPSSFTPEKGNRQLLFVLKRAGKDDQPNSEAVERIMDAAARTRSANNLKQIALAMHNYLATYNHFPAPAIYSNNGKPLLSWRVTILPYIEQDELYRQFKLDEPWDSAHNKALLEKMPKTYAPVLGKAAPNSTFYRVFLGNGAVFEPNMETRIQDIRDGTSNTILVVEAGEAVPWTKPDELAFDPNKPLPKLGGNFKGQFPVAFCDGSVRYLPIGFDEKIFRALVTRAGGEVVDYEALNKKK